MAQSSATDSHLWPVCCHTGLSKWAQAPHSGLPAPPDSAQQDTALPDRWGRTPAASRDLRVAIAPLPLAETERTGTAARGGPAVAGCYDPLPALGQRV
ncbi:MAG: hypothetical protein WAW42_02920 [Candidatus Competibacteraceae bacterium]